MKIAIIGCGNMAATLFRRIITEPHEIFCYTPSFMRAEKLAKEINASAVKNLTELKGMDLYILGMKPQQLDSFVNQSNDLLEHKNVLSMLTAISISSLQQKLNTKQVARIMPNTPSQIGKGIELFTFSDFFEHQQFCLDFFKPCGRCFEVTEEQLDELTVFTGSGPAYVFYFIQQLTDLLESKGYDRAMAKELIGNLFLGASEYFLKSDRSAHDLIELVTSKGGVTAEAMKVFKEPAFGEYFSRAITRASERNLELASAINSLK